MVKLEQQLQPFFQQAWSKGEMPEPKVQQIELKLAAKALQSLDEQVFVLSEQLSFAAMHRHILLIACPDQAFYPDAVRTYLQKQKIQPLQQRSVLHEQGLLLVLHLSAAILPSIVQTQKDITHILQGVHQSVVDFPDMLGSLENIAAHLAIDDAENAALLRWMLDDHYLLFGLLYPQITRHNLGICRQKKLFETLVPHAYAEMNAIPAATKPSIQWLHLAATFSHLYSHTTVRAVQLSWHEKGKLHSVMLLGHFSRGARYINATQLPRLQSIWADMAKDVKLQQSAFYQREIRMLFDRAPKSLLHSIAEKQWLTPFKAVVDMHSPTQVVVEKLQPAQGNFTYIFITVNQHRFGDNIWRHMQQALADLGIEVVGSEGYTVGTAHLMFVAARANKWPQAAQLNQAIQQCIVFWKDIAKQALLQAGLAKPLLHHGLSLLGSVAPLYQDQFLPEQFAEDIKVMPKIIQHQSINVRLKLLQHNHKQGVEVQVLSQRTMPLAWMTEKLNAFALVTMEQAVVQFGDAEHSIHICKFRCQAPEQLHREGVGRLQQGIEDVFNQHADHDPLNALVILAGLSTADVLVMISLRNHLAQLMPNVSIGALSQVMIKYYHVSRALFRIFEGKHRAAMPTKYAVQAQADFEREMQAVNNLKDDTWLRALADIVDASLRCNAWVKAKHDALAIKIDTAALDFAPQPQPYREIFVHGVFVEGVHLRAGAVARGGLRYSDRPTDFRTEVLELMATQVVKNGQIVPTGAKGGFVVRDGQGTDFVLAQYHQFIRALLSLTDNRVGGKLVPPKGIRVAEQDKDDAYLVVAADKGTARFSDDANEEALHINFWLGDAFASGGSYGYDHKAFGITARGAWLCAAHHFSKQGINLNQDEVTVVGIGDMGGDVFGNGMLLNPNLKLLAAFNHQHIFLDPNPDTKKAFAERKRLFKQVKAWGDYDASLISVGGGVFDRNTKRIELTLEVQQSLGIHQDKLSGEALIRAILQAPVDLLYNGGIGTYVKASFETDSDAQDPVNNAVRVNADALRCKVVGEGGNLGFTQAARIEYATCGGLINTDAIDNAAGVNMSDHEVNLKILLADTPFKQRNTWLKKAANDVASQCLNDNAEQAVALSLVEEAAKHHLPRLQQLQQQLLQGAYIAEAVEAFTTRPIYAEWQGHEKNRIHQLLDDANFRQHSVFGDIFLYGYFPAVLRKKFHHQIAAHALANDIAHTRMTSHVLNRYGMECLAYLQNLTQEGAVEIMQALLIADALLDTEDVYQGMFEAGSGRVADWYAVQQDVIGFAEGLLALPDMMQVDEAWLKGTRRTLRSFADKQHKNVEALMPLVTAIAVAGEASLPLSRCLDVTAQVLTVLPFEPLEAVLHTPLWADEEAHALRRDWLNRLKRMKIQAAKSLLQTVASKRTLLLQAWRMHELQGELAGLLNIEMRDFKDEQLRLRYILALSHVQSIVECDCHLG